MAAYAALVSLMNNMEQIQNHPRLSTSLDKKQIESLVEKVGFFLSFIESYNSHGDSKEVEDLESQITSAAHAAEDVIESHIVDQILNGSTEKFPSFLLYLQKIIHDMDSIKENVMKVKDQQPTYSTPAASSRPLTTGKTTMVGFDGYLIQLLEELTGQQSNRKIMAIVGMGGIGKTTLARNVYENLLIVQHFDVRVWVIVSQDCNVRKILLAALSHIKEPTSEMDEKTEDELGEELYKSLSGERYLIIFDDMWSIEAWDRIKFFFPDNGNRSRIVVTSRLSNVAIHFSSSCLELNFLDEDKSWDLFCEKAFPQEVCPPELEKIGKKIVKKCKGLPLSIVVIGGLLAKSSRTQEYWKMIAKDISSILNSSAEDNQLLNILSLSYSHLPVHLKPCFLYLGIFPEDHEIRISRLIKLWVAEGFLKPNKYQSLEEIAEDYIKDLVDRNLILVRRLGLNGKFKTCGIHDLLRALCLRIVEKEKFLCVTRLPEPDTPQNINEERRVIITGRTNLYYYPRFIRTLKSTSLARSLILESPCLLPFQCKLLRVLIEAYSPSLTDTFQQVNLRFLAYESRKFVHSTTATFPSSISLLWNVQTLIIAPIDLVHAPSEIWEMPQLRHLEFNSICLPDPPPSGEQDDFVVLRNLQTLMTVWNFRCSEEVCKRMPNIKKLSISYGDFSGDGNRGSSYCLYNVSRLNKLESLHYSFLPAPNRDDLLQNLMLPSSLKKLTFDHCVLHWSDLAVIGSLPHLEVLRLKGHSVFGPEWNPVEGGFLRLKFLEIYSCNDLIFWNADSSHFPVLENLVLESFPKLDEIPSGIGDIPTLKVICLNYCRVSATISAIKILEEQESLGNQGLQVQVKLWEKNVEEFREKVEVEGLAMTSRNFQMDVV